MGGPLGAGFSLYIEASFCAPSAAGDRMTCDERRNALEKERLRLQAEINSYPMPIPACDVYFNDLLERRSQVCDELARLATPAQSD
jgi:hypothetical protein